MPQQGISDKREMILPACNTGIAAAFCRTASRLSSPDIADCYPHPCKGPHQGYWFPTALGKNLDLHQVH